jgi:hypothetical protein
VGGGLPPSRRLLVVGYGVTRRTANGIPIQERQYPQPFIKVDVRIGNNAEIVVTDHFVDQLEEVVVCRACGAGLDPQLSARVVRQFPPLMQDPDLIDGSALEVPPQTRHVLLTPIRPLLIIPCGE